MTPNNYNQRRYSDPPEAPIYEGSALAAGAPSPGFLSIVVRGATRDFPTPGMFLTLMGTKGKCSVRVTPADLKRLILELTRLTAEATLVYDKAANDPLAAMGVSPEMLEQFQKLMGQQKPNA